MARIGSGCLRPSTGAAGRCCLLLLPVLEVEAVSDEYAFADRIFGQAALWLRSSPWVPALLALGFATSFIHYVLDRAALRFSSPEVRQAARGLLS
jgi:hypothetical protein